MTHQESLWQAVRLQAEGSNWKRDEGETLEAWVCNALHERRLLLKLVAGLALLMTRLNLDIDAFKDL